MEKRPFSFCRKVKGNPSNSGKFEDKVDRVLKEVHEIKEEIIMDSFLKESQEASNRKEILTMAAEINQLKQNLKELSRSVLEGLEEMRENIRTSEASRVTWMKKAIRDLVAKEFQIKVQELQKSKEIFKEELNQMVSGAMDEHQQKANGNEEVFGELKNQMKKLEGKMEANANEEAKRRKELKKSEKKARMESSKKCMEDLNGILENKSKETQEELKRLWRCSLQNKEMLKDLEKLGIDSKQESRDKDAWLEEEIYNLEESLKEEISKETRELEEKLEGNTRKLDKLFEAHGVSQGKSQEFEYSMKAYVKDLAELLNENERANSQRFREIERVLEMISESIGENQKNQRE